MTIRKLNLLVIDQRCQLFSDRVFYRELSRIDETNVTILTPPAWRRDWGIVAADPNDVEGVSVVPGRVLFGFRQHRVVYPGLANLVRSVLPDVLFVNAEPEDWLTWQAVTVVRRHSPRTRVVFLTWRNIKFSGNSIPYKLPRLHALAERRVLSTPVSGIAYCSAAPSLFSDIGFERITYVPPYVDTRLFCPPAPTPVPSAGVLKLGFVGRLHPLKGGEILLRALAGVKGVNLTMVGSGPEGAAWARLATALGLDQVVRWLPAMPHEELPERIRDWDVLVLPSMTGTTWKEQFGRVLAEAMSCGVAVIGSSSGEIPRVIGDDGLVFSEGSTVGLRAAVETLRDDPALRRDLGDRGRSRMLREHSVEVTARRFHAALLAAIH